MIREALDDAGLTLARRRRRSPYSRRSAVDGAGRVPRHPAPLDSTPPSSAGRASRSTSSTPPPPSPLGLCDVAVGVYAATPRCDRKRRGRRRVPQPAPGRRRSPPDRPEWELPYGLRMPMGAYALAASRHMAELRHDVRAAGPDRGRHPRVGAAQPPRPPPGPRSPSTTCSPRRWRLAAAQARLLPRDRRRRRRRDDLAERARDLAKPPVCVLGAGTCHTHAIDQRRCPT